MTRTGEGNECTIDDLKAALSRIPALKGLAASRHSSPSASAASPTVTDRLDTPKGKLSSHPGAGTSEYISRKNEAHAARVTSTSASNAPLVFDETDGIQLCGFIEGAATLNAERFKVGLRCGGRRSLRKGNECGPAVSLQSLRAFSQTIDAFWISWRRTNALPDGYRDVKKDAEAVREALNARALPNARHCDPLAENFFDTGSRVSCVIDWEYAGNQRSRWDLATYRSKRRKWAGAGPRRCSRPYFGGARSRGRTAAAWCIPGRVCDLFAGRSGASFQHVNEKPRRRLLGLRGQSLSRCCKRLMAQQSDFSRLQAVTRVNAAPLRSICFSDRFAHRRPPVQLLLCYRAHMSETWGKRKPVVRVPGQGADADPAALPAVHRSAHGESICLAGHPRRCAAIVGPYLSGNPERRCSKACSTGTGWRHLIAKCQRTVRRSAILA